MSIDYLNFCPFLQNGREKKKFKQTAKGNADCRVTLIIAPINKMQTLMLKTSQIIFISLTIIMFSLLPIILQNKVMFVLCDWWILVYFCLHLFFMAHWFAHVITIIIYYYYMDMINNGNDWVESNSVCNHMSD